MSRHKSQWENHEIFKETPLNLKSNNNTSQPARKSSSDEYGPGSIGCTYELCAGIIDKQLSLQQSVQEEIEEETGVLI